MLRRRPGAATYPVLLDACGNGPGVSHRQLQVPPAAGLPKPGTHMAAVAAPVHRGNGQHRTSRECCGERGHEGEAEGRAARRPEPHVLPLDRRAREAARAVQLGLGRAVGLLPVHVVLACVAVVQIRVRAALTVTLAELPRAHSVARRQVGVLRALGVIDGHQRQAVRAPWRHPPAAPADAAHVLGGEVAGVVHTVAEVIP
mmetsp:Transcript_49881/g.159563  ORF Transcript_49881/g.159563 Transcript_49881/m.159563 type:complete len:201 (-) Transcript_49881:957-1559(-)